MADIFVSYARADKARVAPLVAALEAQGWSVWWDPEITPGQEFDSQIAAALDAAKAVVVVWTPTSVDSRWVRGEAREAADRRILAPVRFEGARLPIDARALHTTDLDDWREDVRSRPFEDLRRALTSLIGDQSSPIAAPAPARRSHSICVLPFANMSGDSEQEYFADGISEDIITDLSKVSVLSVIARNTAFTFKGRSVDAPHVARQLGVSHILEGSVRRAGSRVRITAQLIDGKAGDHVWAERWDRDLEDVFALQDEISQAIVGALRLRLLPEEKKAIEDRGGASVDVYDSYLRARARANRVVTSDDFLAAAEEFRRLLEIDAGFAPARGDLARLYYWTSMYVPDHIDETIGQIERLAQEALTQAPDHWSTHLANAVMLMLRRQWADGAAAFERALDLAPSSVTDVRLAYASCLMTLGRLRESIAVHEVARSLDPLSRETLVLLQDYWSVGRDADARAEYDRSLNMPGNREAQEHTLLWMIWEHSSPEEKRRQFQRYLEHRTVGTPVQEKVMELLDRPSEACALLREAFDDPANQDPGRLMFLGCYAALFGDDDLAVAALRRSSTGRVPFIVMTFWYPILRKARQKPEFKQLVRDLGLYDYWRKSGQWGDFARPLGEDDFELIA
jgi:adenylate cyclase